MAEIVDYFSEAEDMEIVNREGCDEGDIEADQSIAVVHESLVVERRDRQPFLFITGKNPGDEELEEEIARIDFPGVPIGACILRRVRKIRFRLMKCYLCNMTPHTS